MEEAKELLWRAARVAAPIMRRRGWRVGVLREFAEPHQNRKRITKACGRKSVHGTIRGHFGRTRSYIFSPPSTEKVRGSRFWPRGGQLLGLNVNKGEEVKVRVRDPKDKGGFQPFHDVRQR